MIWLAHQMEDKDERYFWQRASVSPDSGSPDRVPSQSMQLTGKYNSKIDAHNLDSEVVSRRCGGACVMLRL